MKNTKPPYEITNRVLRQIASVSEKIGEINAAHLNMPPTELRKKNRIKTIQSSLEFIHPFQDGNGRMGRLWQTLILKEYSPVFEFLPIETLIKEHQQEYYNALGEADKQGKSTVFIEYMLKIINEALEDLLKLQNITLTGSDRILHFKGRIKNQTFSRQV